MSNERQTLDSSSAINLATLARDLPGIVAAYNATLDPTAAAQWNVDSQYAPKYAGQQVEMFKQYAPELNRIGSEIERANALSAAETEAQVAGGPGAELVKRALQYQQELDPEYFATRKAVGKGAQDLLAGQDPNKLTEAELANAERGIARTPGFYTPSAISTVRNAGQFGRALDEKRSRFGQSLATAAGTLQPSKSGITGFEVATRRPLTSNQGANAVPTPGNNYGQQGYNIAGGYNQQLGGFQQAALGKQKSLLENVTGWGEFGGKVVGAAAGAAGV